MSDVHPSTAAPQATGVSYGRQLSVRAAANPDGTALTFIARDATETTLSWEQLERRANPWARALQSQPVGYGEMVALSVPNSVEIVLAALRGSWARCWSRCVGICLNGNKIAS